MNTRSVIFVGTKTTTGSFGPTGRVVISVSIGSIITAIIVFSLGLSKSIGIAAGMIAVGIVMAITYSNKNSANDG